MFDYKHYVPVLRWKRAEWRALKELSRECWAKITPLIEITPKKFIHEPVEDINKLISQIADNLNESCREVFFLDLGLIARHSNALSVNIINALSDRIQNFIPVTNLNQPNVFQAAMVSIMQKNQTGICIRIKKNELKTSNFGNNLTSFISRLNIDFKQADLIIDYEITDSASMNLFEACQVIPSIGNWRTFTVISGTFPKDLTGFWPPGKHLHPRLDWQTWLEKTDSKNKLPRKPTFGDYAIQYPIYSEPHKGLTFSASIRYTSDSDWVIMRGESVKKMGYSQWPANALLLCEQPEFCGHSFSEGDKYIYDRGQLRDKTGSAETWLRAGFSHHLTFVANQLSSLSDF